MTAAFDVNVDVTIELGFGSGPLATSPTWTDVSAFVKAANWNRGRSSVQGDFSAGSGSLFLDNFDGRFYPWNTSSPYSPNVTVGVPVRIRATHNLVTYSLFYGFAARWPMAFPTNTEELAVLEVTETFAILEGKQLTGSYPAQMTNTRIAAILDDVGWPAAMRNLDTGVADVAAITVENESALALLRQAVEAEQGEMFQAADGDLTFLNRNASSAASSAATFGPDGAELTYVDVTATHDDDYLFNEALVTGADDIEQSASDATSITAHGPRTFATTNESIVGQAAALNVAEWIVGKYKDIPPRITGLVIDPAGSPIALWPEALGRELRDVVTVEVSYPGSAVQLVQEVAVESLSHSFAAADIWTVAYGCHPLSGLEQEGFWILGTSALNTTANLA